MNAWTQRRKIINVFFLILLALPTKATLAAEPDEYYWVHSNMAGRFPSPEAVCKTYVETRNPEARVSLLGIRSLSESWFVCDLQDYNPDTQKYWPSTTSTHRYGGRCQYGSLYNPITGTCKISAGKSNVASCMTTLPDNNLNIINGNNYQEEEDFAYAGVSSMKFVRAYNSNGNWQHNYSTKLKFSNDIITLTRPDGSELTYQISGNDLTGAQYDLGHMSKAGEFWNYVNEENDKYVYDSTGRLVSHRPVNRPTQYLSYQNTTIIVTSAHGESLTISENQSHQLEKLEASDLMIRYQYDSSDRLSKVIREQGGSTQTRIYHYENQNFSQFLTGITDERGIRMSTWTYDARGRVTLSTNANGETLTEITYKDSASTVKNAFGKNTTFHFVTAKGLYTSGITRIGRIEGEPSANCPASNSSYSYDARGQILSKTDARGFITQYTYNDKGQETKRVEAVGKNESQTITTTWHPNFNLPLTVTKKKIITTYTYDAEGRETSRTQSAL